MSSSKLIVVVGSGPGIGLSTASLFASKGFTVALLSRDASRLKDEAAKVQQKSDDQSRQVHTYAVDVSDSETLKSVLAQVKKDLGVPEVAFYNAARVASSIIGQESEESVISDFKVINIGLYTTCTWAQPLLASLAKEKPASHPSILITGGGLWEYPIPEYFALSMCKAAQVNFATSLANVVNKEGIHVATVNVGGVVSDNDPVVNATNIAGEFWKLYEQDQKDWKSMVNVGDIRDMMK